MKLCFSLATMSKIRKVVLSAVIIVAMSVAISPSADAIVINDTAGSATAIALGTPLTSVVEIFLGGSLCSGALIDSTHVLTAQHCTFGTAAAAMTVNFHTDNDGSADQAIGVSDKAEVNATNNLLDGTDLAILTLSWAPVGVTPLQFFAGNPTGVTATTVGFGLNGVGSTGHGGTRDGLRWAAENEIDAYGAAYGPGGVAISGTSNIYNTDFDDGTAANNTLFPGLASSATPLTNEGTTAGGDSGGPLMFNNLIVAALSGGTTSTSAYGDISWWTGTYAHMAWILENAPGAEFVGVPEPSTLLLLCSSLIGLGYFRRRRMTG